jgi:hypothetical protein
MNEGESFRRRMKQQIEFENIYLFEKGMVIL